MQYKILIDRRSGNVPATGTCAHYQAVLGVFESYAAHTDRRMNDTL